MTEAISTFASESPPVDSQTATNLDQSTLINEKASTSLSKPDGAASTPSNTSVPLTAGKKAARTRENFRRATLFGLDLNADNYKEMLIAVVGNLQVRHLSDFSQTVQDPKLFRGKKWWAISKNPSELNPHNPKNATNLVGDFYVDIHLSAEDKVRRARQFLKAFGHDANELVIQTAADQDS